MNQDITILIVDDDPDVLAVTSRILTSAGYKVLKAGTGREGLEMAETHRPDLVLLDVVLPDIMGTEVCRRIKHNPAFDGIFVILSSGLKTGSCHQTAGLESGADGYIARPVSNQELTARIDAMVRILTGERQRMARGLKNRDIALDVLLEKRQKEKNEMADTIMDHLNWTVFPYIDRLKTCRHWQDAVTLAPLIEANIRKSVAPFESSFFNCFKEFTPTEIQVADLIRTGKTSKEIAGLLNMSLRSVHFHRNNIRKKLHIQGSKTNLRTFLMSLS